MIWVIISSYARIPRGNELSRWVSYNFRSPAFDEGGECESTEQQCSAESHLDAAVLPWINLLIKHNQSVWRGAELPTQNYKQELPVVVGTMPWLAGMLILTLAILFSCASASRPGPDSSDQANPTSSPLGLSPGPISAAEAALYRSWLGFESPDCHASCEGKPTHWHEQCWGQFHFFCKSPPPEQGITWRKYHASGCLGTESAWMYQSMSSAFSSAQFQFQNDDSDLTKMDSLSSDPAMHDLKTWIVFSRDFYISNTSDNKFVIEGRCQGISEVGNAVRKFSDEAVFPPLTDITSLEAGVSRAMGALDLKATPDSMAQDHATHARFAVPVNPEQLLVKARGSLGGAEAPQKGMLSAFLGALPKRGRLELGHGHLDCDLQCNGKKAWFHGLWPCWGNITLTCTTPAAEAEGQAKPAVDAQDQVAAEGQAKPAVDAQVQGAVDAQDLHGAYSMKEELVGATTTNGWEMGFSITCKGLWTGVFQVCYGETLLHATQASPTASIDRWGICTGAHMLLTHHDKDGFCSKEICQHKSVVHATAMWHEDEEQQTVVA
eukprot:gene12690-15922_t